MIKCADEEPSTLTLSQRLPGGDNGREEKKEGIRQCAGGRSGWIVCNAVFRV